MPNLVVNHKQLLLMETAVLYLNNIIKTFESYKALGNKSISQLDSQQLHEAQGEGNSVAILIQHLSGNMKSRFTDFLTSDGEKPGRNREAEFTDQQLSREQLIELWEDGWHTLLSTLKNLEATDLLQTVYIRKEPHTVLEAINRQIAHYAYHVGQMVMLAKALKGSTWANLSIPKGESLLFNKMMEERYAG